MSNGFDELIKNKVEENQYVYTRSAWHKFCRKANIPLLSVGAKIAILAGVFFAAAGAFFLVKPTSQPVVKSSQTPQQQAPQTVVSDTLDLQEVAPLAEQTVLRKEEQTGTRPKKQTSPRTDALPVQVSQQEPEEVQPIANPTETSSSQEEKPSAPQAKPAAPKDKTQWKRVNVIDLDTVAPY